MFKSILVLFLGAMVSLSVAATQKTHRDTQFSNGKVTVWKTEIQPKAEQKLAMHRHDNDRVIVAFESGTLKITDSKGKSHLLQLEKDKAYFLPRDPNGEFHTDENISDHPLTLLVIQLNNLV